MIRVDNLSVRYGAVSALKEMTLHIPAGESVLVTGPSGCGKSTLARVISGLIPHAIPAAMAGLVRVAGLDTRQNTIAELAPHVGAVFQDPSTQLFHLRVADDVAFGPRNLGLSAEEIQQRVGWALAAVGAHGLADHNPAELSGGQKQLVAIAAALAMKPAVLVLDEPTASLDVTGANRVVAVLKQLRQLGLTIVLTEHRLAGITQLADRVLVLDEGRVVADGPVDDVLGDRRTLKRFGLRRPLADPPSPWTELLAPNGAPPDGVEPLLALRRLSAGYSGRPVIHDIDLLLYPGEFVALVGENGAGKSTLALAAAGLLKPTQGGLSFAGGRRPSAGLDVSLLFQNPAEQLFTDSVEEEVAFAPWNFRQFDRATHERVLREADLIELRARPPTTLSAGQQQRTALASCLSLNPQLVILDEPTLGQDWRHLQRIMDYLVTLNERGTTILLITHDYKLVHRYSRRAVLMKEGRIILDGRPQTVEQGGGYEILCTPTRHVGSIRNTVGSD